MWNKHRYCWQLQNHVWIQNFRRSNGKTTMLGKICVFLHGLMTWLVMQRRVWNDIVSWRTKRLNNSTQYQLHAVMTIISKKKNWNPWENCQKYALRLSWNACIWSVLVDQTLFGQQPNLPEQLQNGPELVTNVWIDWFSYIHHTCEYRDYCHVGNTAQQCRLGLFQDSDFAGDQEDSKSTPVGLLCIFGSHTFVPISWMWKKQTQVSHSSTEAEIISLDASLRKGGIPAFDLWNLVAEVFHCDLNQPCKTKDSYQHRETCVIASCRAHERRIVSYW